MFDVVEHVDVYVVLLLRQDHNEFTVHSTLLKTLTCTYKDHVLIILFIWNVIFSYYF